MVKPGKKLRHVALTQNQTESDAQDHKHNEAQGKSFHTLQNLPHHDIET